MDVFNLKLDEMKVNTELAEEFFKKFKEFHSMGSHANLYAEKEEKIGIYDNKIFYSENYSSAPYAPVEKINKNDLRKFIKLAKKIKETANLFAQLEYVTRKIPIEETKKNVDMVVQNMLYCGTKCKKKFITSNTLIMDKTTPLMHLSFVAQMLLSYKIIVICSIKQTAPICYLFTMLCNEVDIEGLNLIFIRSRPKNLIADIDFNVEAVNSGSIGVITERSDLDSAVDAFISSNNLSPWKLKRILIQESVYDIFKKTMEWKSQLKTNNANSTVMSKVENLCEKVYNFKDKVVFLDFAGTLDNYCNSQIILVESYRTTKELLVLLKEYEAFYLSLWSSDVSEANEISSASNSAMIWINDIANFQGCPETSQAVYSRIELAYSYTQVKKCIKIRELIDLHASWSKISILERIDVIVDVLINIETTVEEESEIISSSFEKIINYTNGKTANIANSYVCVTVDLPVGLVAVTEDNNDFSCLVNSVVNGNGIVFYTDKHKNIVDALNKAGVPVVRAEKLSSGDFKIVNSLSSKTKTIWTNFGTIFAN